MMYTDEDVKRWWKAKTKTDQNELFQTINEKCGPYGSFEKWLHQVWSHWEAGREIHPTDLHKLRKWDHS